MTDDSDERGRRLVVRCNGYHQHRKAATARSVRGNRAAVPSARPSLTAAARQDACRGSQMKTSLSWDGEAVIAVDQRALPRDYRLLRLASVDELIDAVKSLAIRGAPAIGSAGALGLVLSARWHSAMANDVTAKVTADASRLAHARPTAVNLEWGVRRALGRLHDGPDAVLTEALAMLKEDAATNRAASLRAADLVLSLTKGRPLRLLTHCDTGRLATAACGTALGAILELAERVYVAEVLVDET